LLAVVHPERKLPDIVQRLCLTLSAVVHLEDQMRGYVARLTDSESQAARTLVELNRARDSLQRGEADASELRRLLDSTSIERNALRVKLLDAENEVASSAAALRKLQVW
jgi:hypothetical protein